jgi:2'-5' RNA ligase
MPAPGMPPRANAVVSLLDRPTSDRVLSVWRGIEHRLGLKGIFVMPYPHFTYHVAAEYDRPALEAALDRFASTTAPFEVETTGIATFGDPWPVVYIAVDVEPVLRDLHARTWELCASHARDSAEYYEPRHWIPHISLAYGDDRTSIPLSSDEVRQVLALLAKGEYHWRLKIDNFALAIDDGSVQAPVRTFPLRGG